MEEPVERIPVPYDAVLSPRPDELIVFRGTVQELFQLLNDDLYQMPWTKDVLDDLEKIRSEQKARKKSNRRPSHRLTTRSVSHNPYPSTVVYDRRWETGEDTL